MRSLTRILNKKRRRIVGLMSGTSADGVDAALLEVECLPVPVAGQSLSWELLNFVSVPYHEDVRAEILAVQEAEENTLGRVTRLHFILGHLFADAVEAVAREAGTPLVTVDAIASHGQTVAHFPYFDDSGLTREGPGSDSWRRLVPGRDGVVSASTLQIGEPAVLAERTGTAVISNFRSRDVAAGGTGAPLVPLVDHLLFASPDRSRLALNIGGIANFSALRAGGAEEDVVAFDTGPGNMVIDSIMNRTSEGKRHVDEGGALARKGNPDRGLVDELLREPFFHRAPPRAAGRDDFGETYSRALFSRCQERKLSQPSMLSTATWLTARSIHHAYQTFIKPGFEVGELIVSGGGAHNVTLLEYLTELFSEQTVVTSDYYGLDVDAKEAAAFALLAHLSLEGRAGNLPAVTGAGRPVVLGDVTPGGGPA